MGGVGSVKPCCTTCRSVLHLLRTLGNMPAIGLVRSCSRQPNGSRKLTREALGTRGPKAHSYRLGNKPSFEQTMQPESVEKLVRQDLRKEAVSKKLYDVEIVPATAPTGNLFFHLVNT